MTTRSALLTPTAAAFLAVAIGVSVPFAAHAGGYLAAYSGGGYGNYGGDYLSNYSGGGYGGGYQLSNYGGSGYSGGYGGYNNVAYGYTSANLSPDTPHRGTWQQYTRLKANYDAVAYTSPPCGAYDRNPLGCKQATRRWNPLVNH